MAEVNGNQASNDSAADKPPYCSFITFSNFIKMLHDTHVPGRIDTSLMGNMAGGVQSQMMIALRFLGLIGPAGEPSQSLSDLVAAYGTSQWKSQLGEVSGQYHKAVGNLDTDNATGKELEEAFTKHGGVEGSTREKAIRFYLKMLDESGLTYSSHFKRIRKGGGSGARRKKKTPQAQGASPEKPSGSPKPPRVPEGMMDFPIRLPGRQDGVIVVPRDIKPGEVELIKKQVEFLEFYAKQGSDES